MIARLLLLLLLLPWQGAQLRAVGGPSTPAPAWLRLADQSKRNEQEKLNLLPLLQLLHSPSLPPLLLLLPPLLPL